MRFTLTDESLDADRERVLIDGAVLNRFLKNPVMLWRHWGEPIGRWKDIRIEENPRRITAEPEFYEKEPLAKRIADMVRAGFLKACSIGLMPLEKSTEPSMMLPGQSRPTITKFEILEASIVPIPSNSNALVEALEKEFSIIIKEPLQSELRFGAVKIQELQFKTHKPNFNMVEIAKALGLPESASEAEIAQAINRSKEEKATLQKSALDSVIAFGKSKGVINAANEAEYKHLAGVDLEATKQLIEKTVDSVQVQVATVVQESERELLVDKLKEQQRATQAPQGSHQVELKSWQDYEKNAPEQLRKMMHDDPERAQAMADAYLASVLGV